ncbi:MAG: hypothetical protein L3K14_05950 [Thermoplasmata archaeon]|nr:hypothetical protein [Thermoplasmata archaeon]
MASVPLPPPPPRGFYPHQSSQAGSAGTALGSRKSAWHAFTAFLGRHPVLCLMLLSPGIPEYLSSSSPLNALVANPLLFGLQLLANLGLYLPGVLLIREAMVRWNKGWGSVLLLGAAYGILEEGIALSTFYYSNAGPVGSLGYYGHWLGVNWVWIPGVLLVHIVFSISLPILLLGLALPKTRGQSIVGPSGILWALAIWAIDIPVLMIVVHAIYNYWMGWTIFFASFAVIAALVLAAYRAPRQLLPTRWGPPRVSPFQAGLLGVSLFPATLVLDAFLAALNAPPSLTILSLIVYSGGLGYLIVRTLGTVNNERHLVALAAGLIVPIAFAGVVAEIRLPVTLFAVIAAVWFFRHLWRKYERSGSLSSLPVPPGAFATG